MRFPAPADDAAHGLGHTEGTRTILVVDLGARKVDVSLLEVDDGVFEVLAARSDSRLGGSYLTDRLVCVHIGSTAADSE